MLTFKNFFIGGGLDKKWKELRHNGPFFPPEFVPHKTPVIINNKEVILNPLAEEYASMFAKFIGTKYMEINSFKKNFWKDFKPILGLQVDSLESIDFTLIKKYLDHEKDKKANMSKEQKEKIKKEQLKIE